MLVLLVVLLAAAAVCARLGVWQLDRAQLRGAQSQERVLSSREAAPPAPIDDVLRPQTTFGAELLGRPVTVTGTYEPAGQLVVADRALDGRTGSIVLTPLRVAGGAGDGAVLPVARGWVASPDDVVPPPSGEVVVTGFLQASEAAGALDTAAGTAESISPAQLVNVWGGPIYSGYLVLTTSTPPQDGDLAVLPAPEARGGSGLNVQNLGYALQWWIFGLFAVGLWVRLVRDEAAGDPEPVVDAPEDDEPEGDDARERHAGEGDAAPGDLAATGGDTGAPVREPAGGASA
jgi:cytochrome oxidase assembly protein ShyY1